MLVYVIADYGDLHDLAFAEVTQRLYAELGDINATIKPYAVPAFDTYATSFVVAQTAINSRLAGTHKFFVNTAPRKDDLSPRVSNSGEGFAYVKLHNGVEICAVNSGYSLSLLKKAASEMRLITCSRDGSQFRSRDVFPPAFGLIAKGDYTQLGDDIKGDIPDFPDYVVAYTDGYGNMKCSIPAQALEGLDGQDVIVEINGEQSLVRVAQGIFGVADGQFCLSVGSSGWDNHDGSRQKFCEIVKRGGSAADQFSKPSGGSVVTIKPL